ncbi:MULTISPECIES: acyltransferase family protein [Arthrobacter]|uniref:acyltransferase family protein n=1 Tax=Arthrobacter TaxID=1663 RepID=UPI0014051801|nr:MULTISPECIES: acyltransferase family protein [Arthrobacter]MBT8162780.1 acyltransferase [Arthrobacter sp. GN70]
MRTGKVGQRPDIQGLRAFAVIAVILDHLLSWPKGGFVGVDIFFVISGFVITASLLREYERTGGISFWGFYKRRINRIMPAAVLVLITTVAVAYATFSSTRFMSTLWDGLSAFLFSANWRFAAIGTDYFQADGPVSPLQHFWSLAVEEQYYFVWPAVMAAVLVVFGRRKAQGGATRTVTGIAIGVIALGSFAWALHETANSPATAYFSTFSRGWELAVGAGLAIAAPFFTTIPGKLRPVLAWIGIAGMVAALFVTEAGVNFPAPGAALPVVSAAVVIAAGTGTSRHRGLSVLTNPISRYLGDISYSLYLWHFPIIVIGAAIFGDSPYFYPGAAAAILIMSYFSYELVEDPIRTNSWLTTLNRSRRKKERIVSPGYKYKALSLLAVAALTVSGAALARTTSTQSTPVAAPKPAATAAADGPKYGPAVTALQAQITTALAATDWPALNPTMDQAIASQEASPDIKSCGGSGPVNDAACTWGQPGATKTAFIVGDSIAATYTGVLRDIVNAGGDWKIKGYATFGCVFAADLIATGSITDKCTARNEQAVAAINAQHPDMVIIANNYLPRAVNGSNTPMTPDEWAKSAAGIANRIKGATGKIVYLSAPPAEVNIGECYTKVSKPDSCVSTVTSQWQSIAQTEQAVAVSLGGTWVDSRPWFCDSNGRCPSFVGSIPTKLDRNHMTQDYGHHIAGAVQETLKVQAIL